VPKLQTLGEEPGLLFRPSPNCLRSPMVRYQRSRPPHCHSHSATALSTAASVAAALPCSRRVSLQSGAHPPAWHMRLCGTDQGIDTPTCTGVPAPWSAVPSAARCLVRGYMSHTVYPGTCVAAPCAEQPALRRTACHGKHPHAYTPAAGFV